MPTSHMLRELESQPACWREIGRRHQEVRAIFAETGGRMALVGCGTSFYIASALARLREDAGLGASDPFVSSQVPHGRRYPWILAVSRTGTTTETIAAVDSFEGEARRIVITAAEGSPLGEGADRVLIVNFADEESIVQTRFATTALAALRVQLTHDVSSLASRAEDQLAEPIPAVALDTQRFVFVGQGWASALAGEASLKMTEAAGVPSQWYPAMELRHGPLSALDRGTVVWSLGPIDPALHNEVLETGAQFHGGNEDAMVELVLIQRVAEKRARLAGRDPDAPPWLGRSVILT